MGRATVREAVADWFSPPNVPGLNTVYKAEPKLIPGEDYGLDSFGLNDGGSGALAFVFIEEESESRIATGGATSGIKYVTYRVSLVVLFKSVKPDAIDAVDDHDQIIDNIKIRLRANRTLGQQDGTIVFQAGEGQSDIHLVSDLPKSDNAGAVYIWSALDFEVTEMVSA